MNRFIIVLKQRLPKDRLSNWVIFYPKKIRMFAFIQVLCAAKISHGYNTEFNIFMIF